MTDCMEDTIEKVNRVKQKLIKYSEKRINNQKVLEYLGTLKILGVNAEIAKATEICQVLNLLKKKKNAEYSYKAEEIIREFKKEKDRCSNELKCEPISIEVGNKESKLDNKSSKRYLETESEKLYNNQKKKQKLSLHDYKKNYSITQEVNTLDTKQQNNNDKSEHKLSIAVNSSKVKYEKESIDNVNKYQTDDPSDFRIYSKESKTVKQESNSCKLNSISAKPQLSGQKISSEIPNKGIIIPPVPSISLEDLFGDSNPESLSRSKSLNQPVTNLSRAATNIRPSLYIPSLKNLPTEKTSAEIDEALSLIMRQKQSKRMIYTGKKTNGTTQPTVSKLYDLCSKTLVENLDTLPNKIAIYNMTHDFAIAFELLKPVLEKANAKQLENIENYSPHLLSDTDYIWRRIGEQDFKKIGTPDDDESWRELYFKKLDEREQQFQRARNLVSKLQKEKPVERVTQIATIKQTKNFGPYSGSKTHNSQRSGTTILSSTISSKSSSMINPKTKVIVHGSNKPVGMRLQPVMSQGMRATMKMLKVRKK